MIRNQPDQFGRDMMGYEPQPPRYQPLPPVSELEPKDERLVELAAEVGRLKGVNDLLNEDNRRLEMENAELKRNNTQLERRNKSLEEDATSDRAAHRSAEDVVDEFVKELKNRTITKEK